MIVQESQNTDIKEIVLTEVIEPPKNSSFSKHISSNPPLEQESHNTQTPASANNIDELNVLFDTDPNSLEFDDSTTFDSIITQALSDTEIKKNIKIEDSFDIEQYNTNSDLDDTPLTSSNNQTTDTTQESKHDENITATFDKLDNLDAMIDTMMSAPAPTPVPAQNIDNNDAFLALSKKVDSLESTMNTLTLNEDQTQIQDFLDRIIYLEGQIPLLQNSLDEMGNHLQTLLTMPKRINDVEKLIESMKETNSPVNEDYIHEITLIKEKLSSLDASLEHTSEQFQAFSLNEVEKKVTSILEKQNNEANTSLHTTITTITTKLEQLEHTIDSLLKKQQETISSESVQALHNALLPSIEKEAAIAASRIIKEELQNLLTLE